MLIGGSAGSIEALLTILPALKPGLKFPIVIILHRKYAPDSNLADLFTMKSSLPVSEVEEKESIKPGRIYIAPADYHLLFEKDGTFSLDFSEKVNFSRPSIDVSFESAAEIFDRQLVCILLSGANYDGVEGMKTALKYGATLVAQKPESAAVPVMPLQAIKALKIEN
ncbi:MAG TPA: chemotaxis protein CheB, partial [Bacteroidia bacterium]|nr:chemotaxis protein CheB [Bacteroidia bacterium]